MGLALIRTFANGDNDKINDPRFKKSLNVFLVILRLDAKNGSPERQAYVKDEMDLLKEIKEQLEE